jgi:hypothetical protein
LHAVPKLSENYDEDEEDEYGDNMVIKKHNIDFHIENYF